MFVKLRERAEALKTEARGLIDKALAESRALTSEEETRKAAIRTELERLDGMLREAREMGLDQPPPPPPGPVPPAAPALHGTPPNPQPGQRFSVPALGTQPGQQSGRPRYSLLRALRVAADQRQLDGFEGEVSQELAKRVGRAPRGFFVPFDFESPLEPRDVPERRDLNLTTGAYVKATITDASNFIELLRNAALVRELGATILAGLVGDLSIPKQLTAGTAYWFDSESATVTESNQTTGQVALAPKTLGTMTDISRKLLLQSSIDAETFVRADLAQVMAIELDRAVINGSGSGAEPEGILQNSSIGTVAMGTNGAAPDWASLVALETNVAVANAAIGSLAYLTNAKVRGKLKTVPKVSGQANFLMDPDQTVNGYRCGISNQVPSNLTKGSSSGVCSAAIFGNWRDVLIGFWGGLDVLVDPYTGGAAGTLRIRMFQDADIKFRHTASFCKVVDYLTT